MIGLLVLLSFLVAWVVSTAFLYATREHFDLVDDWPDATLVGVILAIMWPLVLTGLGVWLLARGLVRKFEAVIGEKVES